MAGRRPKPKLLKLITGNPGKRKIREDEPEGVPGWPEKPSNLPKEASLEWDRLANLLESELRLTTADGPMLTGAALAYDAALTIRKKLKGRGLPTDLWLRLKTGERMQWDTYRKFVNDLCLSQGTRARASKGGGRGKQTSRLEGFIAGGKARKPSAG
jgi:hypothetical protein